MAEAVYSERHTVQPHAEVDMADDEIQKLLLEAEKRLQAPDSKTTKNSRLQLSDEIASQNASSL